MTGGVHIAATRHITELTKGSLMPAAFKARNISLVVAVISLIGCSEASDTPTASSFNPRFAKAPAGLTVQAASPSAAPQNATLDVQISGTGFATGSNAEWLLNGQPDSRVKTNSTRFVSSTSLVANITIDVNAVPAS